MYLDVYIVLRSSEIGYNMINIHLSMHEYSV